MVALSPKDVAFTIDGIDFREVYGKESTAMSGHQQIDDGRRREIRVYDVDWEKRNAAIVALIGYSTVASSGGKMYVSRKTPDFLDGGNVDNSNFGGTDEDYINSDGDNYLYATKILEGHGFLWSDWENSQTGEVGSFNAFRIAVQYETLPFYVLSDADMIEQGFLDANGNPDESFLSRYCKIEVKNETQYLTLARGQFQISSGQGEVAPTAYPFDGSKVFPFKRIRITRYQIPERAVPIAIINPGQAMTAYADISEGTVNSTILLQCCNPGTMVLENTEAIPETSPFGDRVYTLIHEWRFNKNKWNYVYWPKAAALQSAAITANPGGAAAAIAQYNNGCVQIRATSPGADPTFITDSDVSQANQGLRIYDATDHNNVFRVP